VDNAGGRIAVRPTVAGMSGIVPVGSPGVSPVPVVPGYTLESRLGRGGSGEVWRAVPRRGGPAVAVKVLVAGDPQRQAREAALLGELDHPHLVRLIEVVHQPRRGGEARVALVLELLAGGSLAALLARRGRLRPGEVVTAVAPVAAALAHAHAQGVVHGDLSPGNIVFTAEGRPVLTDLGVARVLGESAAGEVTPPYVDPTVARGGAPGPASDVFGIAAAAFHALTGVAPWNAATPADTLAVAADGRLPDLAELAPDAPPELVAVVLRGLAADPHDRGTAAEFALDLRHACRPEPVRLPAADEPEGDLSTTFRRDRTELTHQVPGRRPRPAPVIVASAGRWRPGPATPGEWWGGRARLVDGRAAALGLVLAGVLVVGWLGVRSGAAPDGEGPAGTSAVAATSALPVTSAPTASTAPRDDAPRDDAPGSPAEWRALVADLYERRAAAFATADPAGLADVYLDGSPQLAADERFVSSLAAAGETLRGFSPSVVDLTAVEGDGRRVQVHLVDRWPAHEVVAAEAVDGPALRSSAGRPETAVRMLLVRTGDGWRIESAERTG
jgi:hypothetical protein